MKFKDIELPSNKKFGYFFTLIFFILSVYFFSFENYPLSLFFLMFSVILFLITIFKPSFLTIFNKSWMFLGFVLGKISMYYLRLNIFIIFSPVGIIRRFLEMMSLNYMKKIQEHHGRKELTIMINHTKISFKLNFNKKIFMSFLIELFKF